MSVFELLYIGNASDPYLAVTGLIYILEVILIDDDAACRKIRSLDISHEFSGGDLFIHDKCLHGINGLTKVMRGDVGSHTYGYTLGSVYEKVGDPAGKNLGLALGLIEVRHEINCILVQIVKEGKLGDLLKSCLRITHRSCTVAFGSYRVRLQGEVPF